MALSILADIFSLQFPVTWLLLIY